MTTSQMFRRGMMFVPRFVALTVLLLGFGVVGILAFFVTEVEAATSCQTGYKLCAGYCIKAGSVITDIEMLQTGTQRDPKRFRTDVSVEVGDSIYVFCGNKAKKGAKQPPGQLKVVLQAAITDFCDESVQITGPQNGGTGTATCATWDDPITFLPQFDQYCPVGQFALAVVPVELVARLTYYDPDDYDPNNGLGTPKESFDAFCTLPDAANYGWGKAASAPESRFYDCFNGPQL